MSASDEPLPRAFERHVQSGIGIVLIGLVGWVGITVTQNSNRIATVGERQLSIKEDVKEIKRDSRERMLNVVEVPHLRNEIRALKQILNQSQDRLNDISSRIRSLEDSREKGEGR